jgi:predicted amidohydrolase
MKPTTGVEREQDGMVQTLKMAVAQPLCRPGDISGNLGRMESMVAQAAREGARLVLFAEGGYRKDFPSVTIGDEVCRRLAAMAGACDIVVAAGFMEQDGDARHLSHGVFFPDGRLLVQRKARPGPPEGDMPDWRPGPDERRVFEVDGVRCAISICADTGIPGLWNTLARQGVQVHLIPTAGVGPRSWGFSEAALDEPSVLEAAVKKAESMCFSGDAIRECRRHRMVMASCNQMADNGSDYFHPGHSMIVDTTGELTALIPGVCIFEHLRERLACGVVHPQMPREVSAV